MSSQKENGGAAGQSSGGGGGSASGGQGKSEREREGNRRFNEGLSRAVGDVVRLMSLHRFYRHAFVSDIRWMIVPPIVARQYRPLVNRDEETIGCLLWAEVSDRTRERLRKGGWKLQPDEWNGGPNAIVMMVLAPPGMEGRLLQELKVRSFGQRRLEVASWAAGMKQMELTEVELPTVMEKAGEGEGGG